MKTTLIILCVILVAKLWIHAVTSLFDEDKYSNDNNRRNTDSSYLEDC